MHNDSSHEPDVDLGYEVQETLTPSVAFKFFASLVVMVVVTMIIVWGLEKYLVKEAGTVLDPALVQSVSRRETGAAFIQNDPEGEKKSLLRRQQSQINQYGWVDEEKGRAQIPIRRAIEILGEKGMQPTPPAQTNDGGAIVKP